MKEISIPSIIEKEMFHFFNSLNDRTFIVFDTESNGLYNNKQGKDCSPLSLSAIKIRIDDQNNFKEIGRYNRYYYPVETTWDEEAAQKSHGLNEEIITQKRGFNCSYPRHFKDDSGFYKFSQGAMAYVGHNIEYDLQVIFWRDKIKSLCTKEINEPILKIPPTESMIRYGRGHQFKAPNLTEAAKFWEIPLQEGDLHSSMYDVEVTLKVLEKVYQQVKFKLIH